MAAQIHRILPLVLLLPLSGCALVGASLLGGDSGYQGPDISELTKACEQVSRVEAKGESREDMERYSAAVECFRPERWE